MKKGSELIDKARAFDIPVVTVDFITELSPQTTDIVALMKEKLVSDWTPLDSIAGRLNVSQELKRIEEPRSKFPFF
jgi:hypothetical protein